MINRPWISSALLGLLTAGTVVAGDWPQFRGPTGDGVVSRIEHPLEWSADKNIAWKVAQQGAGWSSPVVVGNKVFITSAAAEGQPKPKDSRTGSMDPRSTPFFGGAKAPDKTFRFELHCLDLTDGKTLWKRLVEEAKPKIASHPSNTFATESPAADAERVYAFFGTTGLLTSWDLQGEKIWEKRLEVYPVTFGFGTGSSLMLRDGRLYLQRDNDAQSSLTAFDAKSGKELWKADRPGKSSWATPHFWRNKERTELVACGNGVVVSYDPATGKELWRLGGLTSSFSASPASTEDIIIFGSSGPLSSSPLYAVKAGASGDITLPNGAKSNDFVVWSRTGSGPGMASPVAYDGLVYVPGEGILKVFETATGKEAYRQRFPKGKMVVSSPWAADGKIFFLDESGQTFIIKAGSKFEVVGVNKLDDTFWSTPALAGESLLLRGVDSLYCVRGGAPAKSK